MRAGERSPRSQVTHGSGEKPWREKGAGAQRWSHYRRPRPRPRTALKPATRRGRLLGSTRPRAALLGSAAAAAPRTGRGDARREGRRPGGKGAAPGTGATSSLPPTARGVADVRPSSGASPPATEVTPPTLPPPGPTSPRREAGLRPALGRLPGGLRGSLKPSLSGEAPPGRPDAREVGRREGSAGQGLSGSPSSPSYGAKPTVRTPHPLAWRREASAAGTPVGGGIAAVPRCTARHRAELALAACGHRASLAPARATEGPSVPEFRRISLGFLTFKHRLARQQLAFLMGSRSFTKFFRTLLSHLFLRVPLRGV